MPSFGFIHSESKTEHFATTIENYTERTKIMEEEAKCPKLRGVSSLKEVLI